MRPLSLLLTTTEKGCLFGHRTLLHLHLTCVYKLRSTSKAIDFDHQMYFGREKKKNFFFFFFHSIQSIGVVFFFFFFFFFFFALPLRVSDRSSVHLGVRLT